MDLGAKDRWQTFRRPFPPKKNKKGGQDFGRSIRDRTFFLSLSRFFPYRQDKEGVGNWGRILAKFPIFSRLWKLPDHSCRLCKPAIRPSSFRNSISKGVFLAKVLCSGFHSCHSFLGFFFQTVIRNLGEQRRGRNPDSDGFDGQVTISHFFNSKYGIFKCA